MFSPQIKEEDSMGTAAGMHCSPVLLNCIYEHGSELLQRRRVY
jgi:hypothetical protein